MSGKRGWTAAAFVVVALSGIGLLAVVVSRSAVDGAEAGDELVALAAPVLTDEGLAELRADFERVSSTADALTEVGVPRLAALAGTTPPALLADREQNDPELAAAIGQLPALQQLGDRIVSNLERRQGQFESAESLPGLGLSLEQGVWAIAALGIALVVVGVVGLWRPSSGLLLAATATGVGMLVVPLVLGYPSKTSDTDALLDSLRPFSEAKVAEREAGITAVRRILDGIPDVLVPAVAAAAGTSRQTVQAELGEADDRLSGENFQEVGDIADDQFVPLVRFSRTIQPLLVQTTELPARATTWLMVIPGIAITAVGGIALVLDTRRRRR